MALANVSPAPLFTTERYMWRHPSANNLNQPKRGGYKLTRHRDSETLLNNTVFVRSGAKVNSGICSVRYQVEHAPDVNSLCKLYG